MTFSHIPGNDAVKTYLQNMIDQGRVGHAFLFTGPKGTGKQAFAEALARAVVCPGDTRQTHPDIRIYQPSGKTGMHSIDSMRQFSEDVALTPYESQRKAFIMSGAHRMLPTAANALLKTFEEPSPDTIIILVSDNKEAILPTILSRCCKVRFHQVERGDEEAELSPQRKYLLDALSQQPFQWQTIQDVAKQLAEILDQQKKEQQDAARDRIPKDLPALQRQNIEKEIDGQVTIQYLEEVDTLLSDFLNWFRDINLLRLGADPSLIRNTAYREALQKQSKETFPQRLERLQRVAKDTRLAVERFTPLQSCLEGLLLQSCSS